MEIEVDLKKVKIWDLNDYYKAYDKERGYFLKGNAPILLKIHPYYVELDSLLNAVPHSKIPIVSKYVQAVKRRALETFMHKVHFRFI